MHYVRVLVMTLMCLGAALPLQAAIAAWDPHPDPGVQGYVLSYGTQPGVHTSSIDVGNVVTYEFFPPLGQRYYVVVQAYSSAGLGAKSDEVILDLTTTTNQPPTLSQPANQSSIVNTSVSLTLTGSDPEGGVLTYGASGLPPGLGVNPSTGVISGVVTTAGAFVVTATVSDGSLSDNHTFTWSVTSPTPVDTTPPVVALTAPANNATVSGKKATLSATASDGGGIAGVRFMLDGAVITIEDTTPPYTLDWNSTTATNGPHQLTAVARDAAGNIGVSPAISITVKNGGRRPTQPTQAVDQTDAGGAVSPASSPTEPDITSQVDSGDIPLQGDFDGDGRRDPATYQAATGEWRVWPSSGDYAVANPIVWGAMGDIPVPADFDGDRRTDIAVFRPATGTWHVLLSSADLQSGLDIQWGGASDRPLAFDFDGDGRADLALPRLGGFEILLSGSHYTTSVTVR